MNPKFKACEEVVLQSKTHPHLNGDRVVIRDPIMNGDIYLCPHCGTTFKLKASEKFAYFLDIPPPDDCCKPWYESALRKKHKPSDFQSFDEMIKEINRMVKA